jgi:hypothetical protein
VGHLIAQVLLIARRPPDFEIEIDSSFPADLLKPAGVRRSFCGVAIRRAGQQHAEPAPAQLRLLRARRKRPRRCRTAEQPDELAPLHSITPSARASSVGGNSRPSALAVLRLMHRENCVASSTGRSAGRAPLRTRSVSAAVRR